MAIPFWAAHYIGLPYVSRGRSVEGVDCWGLVRLILKEQLKVHVPSYAHFYDSSENEKQIGTLVENVSQNWISVPISRARLGDVIVLRMRGAPMHVGLICDETYMLHIERGINAVLEKYTSRRWSKRIEGVFRYKPT